SGDGSGHERCQKYLAQIFDRGSGFGLTLGLEPIWDTICIVKTNFIYSYWIQFQGKTRTIYLIYCSTMSIAHFVLQLYKNVIKRYICGALHVIYSSLSPGMETK